MKYPPIFIEVALWYYCRGNDHPSIVSGSPYSAYHETAEQMVGLGLLEATGASSRIYRGTDGLNVYVEALCDVPTPVQRWVIPDES